LVTTRTLVNKPANSRFVSYTIVFSQLISAEISQTYCRLEAWADSRPAT